MKVEPTELWTNNDFLAGRCSTQDIGRPKPDNVPITETELLAELSPQASIAEMNQAALRVARDRFGYEEFFRRYPTFHQKYLLAMQRVTNPPPPTAPLIDVPWIKQSRLSYKRETLTLVEDAVVHSTEPNAE